MQTDPRREARPDPLPVVLAWGTQAPDTRAEMLQATALWFSGGIVLALWTGLALVLTTA